MGLIENCVQEAAERERKTYRVEMMNSDDGDNYVCGWVTGKYRTSGVFTTHMRMREATAEIRTLCIYYHGRCYVNCDDFGLMVMYGLYAAGQKQEMTIWIDDDEPSYIAYVLDGKIYSAVERSDWPEVLQRNGLTL